MSDLVERLRQRTDPDGEWGDTPDRDCKEAADRIEALEKALTWADTSLWAAINSFGFEPDECRVLQSIRDKASVALKDAAP